jgi:hypothetical protein
MKPLATSSKSLGIFRKLQRRSSKKGLGERRQLKAIIERPSRRTSSGGTENLIPKAFIGNIAIEVEDNQPVKLTQAQAHDVSTKTIHTILHKDPQL